MICPKCGQNIEDNAFCPFCGFGISIDNSKNLIESNNVVNEDENEINELSTSSEEDLIINNNPFSCTGRITRLPYFLTSLVLWIFFNIFNFINYLYNRTHDDSILSIYYASSFFMIIIAIIAFFAIIKRLRDIKWNPWLCLISFVPIVSYIFGLTLLFMKSKYKDAAN